MEFDEGDGLQIDSSIPINNGYSIKEVEEEISDKEKKHLKKYLTRDSMVTA
jgi:hypothetical protein